MGYLVFEEPLAWLRSVPFPCFPPSKSRVPSSVWKHLPGARHACRVSLLRVPDFRHLHLYVLSVFDFVWYFFLLKWD